MTTARKRKGAAAAAAAPPPPAVTVETAPSPSPVVGGVVAPAQQQATPQPQPTLAAAAPHIPAQPQPQPQTTTTTIPHQQQPTSIKPETLIHERQTLQQKLESIRTKSGSRPPPPVMPPLHETSRRAHWDYVLGEMEWMAVDFQQERKLAMAQRLAINSAILERHSKRKQSRAAAAVKEFWNHVASNVDPGCEAFWAVEAYKTRPVTWNIFTKPASPWSLTNAEISPVFVSLLKKTAEVASKGSCPVVHFPNLLDVDIKNFVAALVGGFKFETKQPNPHPIVVVVPDRDAALVWLATIECRLGPQLAMGLASEDSTMTGAFPVLVATALEMSLKSSPTRCGAVIMVVHNETQPVPAMCVDSDWPIVSLVEGTATPANISTWLTGKGYMIHDCLLSDMLAAAAAATLPTPQDAITTISAAADITPPPPRPLSPRPIIVTETLLACEETPRQVSSRWRLGPNPSHKDLFHVAICASSSYNARGVVGIPPSSLPIKSLSSIRKPISSSPGWRESGKFEACLSLLLQGKVIKPLVISNDCDVLDAFEEFLIAKGGCNLSNPPPGIVIPPGTTTFLRLDRGSDLRCARCVRAFAESETCVGVMTTSNVDMFMKYGLKDFDAYLLLDCFTNEMDTKRLAKAAVNVGVCAYRLYTRGTIEQRELQEIVNLQPTLSTENGMSELRVCASRLDRVVAPAATTTTSSSIPEPITEPNTKRQRLDVDDNNKQTDMAAAIISTTTALYQQYAKPFALGQHGATCIGPFEPMATVPRDRPNKKDLMAPLEELVAPPRRNGGSLEAIDRLYYDSMDLQKVDLGKNLYVPHPMDSLSRSVLEAGQIDRPRYVAAFPKQVLKDANGIPIILPPPMDKSKRQKSANAATAASAAAKPGDANNPSALPPGETGETLFPGEDVFSLSEDASIVRLVEVLGPNFVLVAEHLNRSRFFRYDAKGSFARTVKAVQERYQALLRNPVLLGAARAEVDAGLNVDSLSLLGESSLIPGGGGGTDGNTTPPPPVNMYETIEAKSVAAQHFRVVQAAAASEAPITTPVLMSGFMRPANSSGTGPVPLDAAAIAKLTPKDVLAQMQKAR